MIISPIWRDTYFEYDGATLTYTIEMEDGTVIFSGKAYRYPDANMLRINMNKICQDYLSVDIDFDQTARLSHPDFCHDFILKDEGGRTLETYRFYYDWSYEPWNGQTTMEVSHPVNGHYAVGMRLMGTVFDLTAKTAYTIPATTIYPTLACGDYTLYYLNTHGGWDAFLIEGNMLKKDAITQHTYSRSFDNTTREFESSRYISEIGTTYELHTGWLTDQQAENLAKNLINSNKVYAHDLNTDRIFPVIITDNTADYKTYKNQGKKMVNYTINIKESQSKIRK